MSSSDAVVLGAGPAGLGAALALARAGVDVTLVDAADEPGGPLRHPAARRVRVRHRRPHPVRPRRRAPRLAARSSSAPTCAGSTGRSRASATARSCAGATSTSAPRAWRCCGGATARPRGELGARFGVAFVNRVMRPYLEKIDGLPLERIPAERARRLLEDQAAPDGFHFPAAGIGQLMDAMAAAARDAGARVRLGTAVEAIEVPGGAPRRRCACAPIRRSSGSRPARP